MTHYPNHPDVEKRGMVREDGIIEPTYLLHIVTAFPLKAPYAWVPAVAAMAR